MGGTRYTISLLSRPLPLQSVELCSPVRRKTKTAVSRALTMAPSPRSGDELLGNAMRSPGNSTTDARLRAEQHPTYKMGTLSKLVGFFYVDEHVPELTWTIQMDADMICRRSDAPFDTVSGVTYRLDDLGWIWMCTPTSSLSADSSRTRMVPSSGTTGEHPAG